MTVLVFLLDTNVLDLMVCALKSSKRLFFWTNMLYFGLPSLTSFHKSQVNIAISSLWWCPRRDSNSHDITIGGFWVRCVYHKNIAIYSTTKFQLYHTSFTKLTTFGLPFGLPSHAWYRGGVHVVYSWSVQQMGYKSKFTSTGIC